jgi:prevent-host-death family protein
MTEAARDLPITDAREHLAEVVNEAAYGGTVTYLTRRGRRLAAVVPIEAAEALERLEDAYLARLADESLAEIAAGGKRIPLLNPPTPSVPR